MSAEAIELLGRASPAIALLSAMVAAAAPAWADLIRRLPSLIRNARSGS